MSTELSDKMINLMAEIGIDPFVAAGKGDPEKVNKLLDRIGHSPLDPKEIKEIYRQLKEKAGSSPKLK